MTAAASAPVSGGTQPGPSPWLSEARTFVQDILTLTARDTGARAALRSGVGKDLDRVPRMHRIVAPKLPGSVLHNEDGQRAYYAVAAFIAAYHRAGHTSTGAGPGPQSAAANTASGDTAGPPDAPPVGTPSATADRAALRVAADRQRRDRFGDSLGMAYAAAVARGAHNGIRDSAAETRLHLLSKQSPAGLHRHLPAAVRQLCDRNTAPDWSRLLVDLRDWPENRHRIARRWLQDYYRARAASDLAAARQADDTRPDTTTAPAASS